jgi:aminoglycoside phosphotransferase (APT) family kinase protein
MNTLPKELQDLTEIRVNQRFGTFSATDTVTGDKVFVKQIRHPELSDSLRKEAYGLERIAQLTRVHTFPFAVPKVLRTGEDYLVTTWAEGEIMALAPTLPDIAERVRFLAEGYAAIDVATETVHPGRATFGVPGDKQKSVTERISALLATIDTDPYFDADLIQRSLDYLDTNLPSLTTRFTHADFTPNNIIEHGETRTLIDWESASEIWPRFYDVVNFTHNRALSQPELKSALRDVVTQFFANINSSADAHLVQLNTIAAVRALGSISDLMTEPNSYHNTTEIMTPEAAAQIKETLDNVLSGRLYI